METTNIPPILACAAGAVTYFILWFHGRKSDVPFSILYWIKDNWYNVLVTAAVLVLWMWVNPNMEPVTAFLTGASCNTFIDSLTAIIRTKGKTTDAG